MVKAFGEIQDFSNYRIIFLTLKQVTEPEIFIRKLLKNVTSSHCLPNP